MTIIIFSIFFIWISAHFLAGFGRPSTQKISTLMDGVDEQTKNDLDYVDEQLDHVLVATKQLNDGIIFAFFLSSFHNFNFVGARNMQYELDRQNKVIQNTNTNLNNAIAHTQGMNQRLDRQNEKY